MSDLDTRAELTLRWLALERKGWVFQVVSKEAGVKYMFLQGRYRGMSHQIRVIPPWSIHHERETARKFESWTSSADDYFARHPQELEHA
jgi:hypothetical protein